jgi:hypothetical protein
MDGDLDLVAAGTKERTGVSRIYRNDGGTLVDINAPLRNMHSPARPYFYLKLLDYYLGTSCADS